MLLCFLGSRVRKPIFYVFIYFEKCHSFNIYICVEHMYIEYYSTTKNEIMPFTTKQMDLDGIMLDEISQIDK